MSDYDVQYDGPQIEETVEVEKSNTIKIRNIEGVIDRTDITIEPRKPRREKDEEEK